MVGCAAVVGLAICWLELVGFAGAELVASGAAAVVVVVLEAEGELAGSGSGPAIAPWSVVLGCDSADLSEVQALRAKRVQTGRSNNIFMH